MPALRVLVIGGYGFFGRRLVQRLSPQADLQVIVAGRSLRQAQATAAALQQPDGAQLTGMALDSAAPTLPAELAKLNADLVVLAAGPFQGANHHVARACIAARVHYVDLADGRAFVVGIAALDSDAAAAGVAVISGASSVPALSSAVADHLAQDFTRVQRIDIGISPGNRTERGIATMRAILSYCGKPVPDMDGKPTRGWSGARRHVYPPPVGARLLSPCDVPDLALLPTRYAGAPAIRFGAGLELAFLHRGMNAMALLARWGLVRDWSLHAAHLKRAADWFKRWGSDAGAMHVQVSGTMADGRARTRTWHLVATGGDGPYVPTLAAAAWVRRLKQAGPGWGGARPCVGLLSLADFEAETAGLHIRMSEAAS
jgi:hypothetical protein